MPPINDQSSVATVRSESPVSRPEHQITTADTVRNTRRQGRSDLECVNQVLRSRFPLMDSPYSIRIQSVNVDPSHPIGLQSGQSSATYSKRLPTLVAQPVTITLPLVSKI